jgi:hypothetical protein
MKKEHHYFAASLDCFTTSVDLEDIVARMKVEACDFTVWWVPLPLFSNYEVVDYAPQVEGAHTLSRWTYVWTELETKDWSNAPI